MLKIKLFPQGKKHQRSFRIVVSEQRSKHNGSYQDILGYFLPSTKELKLDKDKLNRWTGFGAQLTEGVKKLISQNK